MEAELLLSFVISFFGATNEHAIDEEGSARRFASSMALCKPATETRRSLFISATSRLSSSSSAPISWQSFYLASNRKRGCEIYI